MCALLSCSARYVVRHNSCSYQAHATARGGLYNLLASQAVITATGWSTGCSPRAVLQTMTSAGPIATPHRAFAEGCVMLKGWLCVKHERALLLIVST